MFLLVLPIVKQRMYEFGVVSNGITSIPTLMKICPAIRSYEMRTCRYHGEDGITSDDVIRGVIRMHKGLRVMVSSSSHLTNLSIRHVVFPSVRIKENEFGVVSNGIMSIPNFMKIRLAVL
jgi:hypothetical protein